MSLLGAICQRAFAEGHLTEGVQAKVNPETCAMHTFPKGSSKALGRNRFGLLGSKARRMAIMLAFNWWEGGRGL